MRMVSDKARKVLTNDELNQLAPSVFAEAPKSHLSDRYAFIPTIQVVDVLRAQGWFPVYATQSNARTTDGKMSGKHLVKFHRAGDANHNGMKVGDSVVEISLLNAHDGTTVYQLFGGLYRLVCGNGLMVGENVESYKIKHIGYKDDQVIEATSSIMNLLPKLTGTVEILRDVSLSREEQLIFAESALTLKYDEGQEPISAEQLLLTRRAEDRQSDLWSTFNTVQENMIRGGLRAVTRNEEGQATGRTRTRAVTSVSENVRLNRALWTLAESMGSIKTGQVIGA